MKKQFTLGKKERLKSRKSIEQLFSKGIAFNSTPFRIYYLTGKKEQAADDPCLQFSAGVSSKNFKRAVDRNRIKRLIREAYRLQKNSLQEMLKEKNTALDLFLIYTGKEMPEYQQIFDRVGAALKTLSSKF